MSSTPEVKREIRGFNYSINGKTKPRQLQPLLDQWQDNFDWKKHEKKNRSESAPNMPSSNLFKNLLFVFRRLLRETNFVENMV